MSKLVLYGAAIQCLLFTFVLAADIEAQQIKSVREVRIELQSGEISLSDLLVEIESKTDFKFSYYNSVFNPDKKIRLSRSKSTVSEVLMQISQEAGLRFKQINNNIKIEKKASEKSGEVIRVIIQGITITGRVTTVEDNSGLPGVNIVVKGAIATGTVTDINGEYQITVPDDTEILVFSSVGYVTTEIEINNRSVIDVSLVLDVQALSEVVVVGYGTQERAKVTSAVSRLTGDKIAEQPVISVDQALQGRVSGVYIAGSGSPGRNPTVRIRGLGSALNSDPLFVIDGIPVGQSALNEIHPDNIENISVLKDAASTAIYGSRGANGVVLITTKKGKVGKGKLTASAYYGWQKIPENTRYDLLNTDQYINFAQNSFGVTAPRFDDYDFENKTFRTGTASEEFIGVETNWQDELMPAGNIQDYYIGYSGGSEKITYNVGGGYFEQDGTLINTYFKRATLNVSAQARLGEKFNFGQSLVLSRSVNNQDNRTPIIEAIQMMPYIPVRDPSRQGGFRGPDNADNADPFQPILHTTIVDDESVATKLFASGYGEYELFSGLKLRFQAGIENSFTQNQNFVPAYNAGDVGNNVNPTARFSRSSWIYLSPILTSTINYNKTFGDHTIDAVAGYERQIFQFESVNAGSNILPNENVRNPASAPIESQTAGVFVQEWGIISWFGRVNYDFRSKYLFGASVRRDESSIFAPGNRVGVFPSLSFGWRVADEPFFTGLSNIFTDLKLRGSWGINGNTAVSPYSWDEVVYSDLRYNFGDDVIVDGLTTNTLFNQELQWESVRKLNIGLDAEFFQGKATASLEWFSNQTNDLIVSVPIASSTGIENSPLGNIGDVENKGFEITLGYTEQEGAVKWSVDANASFVKNEVKKIGVDENASVSGRNFWNTATPATRAEAGEPIGFYYGWKVDRIYNTQGEIDEDNALAAQLQDDPTITRQGAGIAPGDIRFQDLNGDGIINGDDRTNIGHYLPDMAIGVNGTASYKNLDLTVNILGAFGFELLHANRYYTEGMTRLFNMGTEVLDAWTEQNQDTDIPRANPDAAVNNARLSDRWVEKGDFIRVKFLTLGYTLPKFSNGLENIRVYAQAQNLVTFTKYTGYDPEVQGKPSFNSNSGENRENSLFFNGFDEGTAPNPRTFILGVQLTF